MCHLHFEFHTKYDTFQTDSNLRISMVYSLNENRFKYKNKTSTASGDDVSSTSYSCRMHK